MRKLNRAKRAKELAPDMFYVPRGELVLQLKDSLGNLLEERREKITISSVVTWEKLTADFTAKEEGEVTVFIDNQDTEAVYFDELELRVESNPTLVITQEHHYYPFGMNMSGIERQGDLMYQFNGMIEKEEAFGLELYETPFRSYDAQLGRFWQVDALADQLHGTSVFQFAYNNPISLNDPTGLKPSDKHLKKEDIEYTYSFDEGSWLNSSGQQVSTGEAMGWVHGSYLWDNRDDVLTLSGDIMVKALSLMGEGEITNFAISQGKGRGEIARITYEHKATNGQRSLVGISLETNYENENGGRGGWLPIKRPPWLPKIPDNFPISKLDISINAEYITLRKGDNRSKINDSFFPGLFTIVAREHVHSHKFKLGLPSNYTHSIIRENYGLTVIGGIGGEWLADFSLKDGKGVLTRKATIKALGFYIELSGNNDPREKIGFDWMIGFKQSLPLGWGDTGIKLSGNLSIGGKVRIP